MSGEHVPGRLAGLLANASNLSARGAGVTRLAVQTLVPGRGQPRRHFNQAALESLAESIRHKGVLTPLLVRPLGNGQHEIVAGERRWRAAQLAGLADVPAVSRPMTDEEAGVLALMENLQREDLSAFDEIEGKARLVAAALGVSQEGAPTRLNENLRNPSAEDVAILEPLFRLLGRETWQSYAKNKLRVLNWPPALVEALREGMALGLASLIAGAPEAHHAELLALWREGKGRAEIAAAKERLARKPRAPLERRVSKALGDQRWLDRLGPEDRAAIQLWLEQMPRAVRAEVEEA